MKKKAKKTKNIINKNTKNKKYFEKKQKIKNKNKLNSKNKKNKDIKRKNASKHIHKH